ncbi:hypothetical protein D3C80_1778990 [compost metagenome]
MNCHAADASSVGCIAHLFHQASFANELSEEVVCLGITRAYGWEAIITKQHGSGLFHDGSAQSRSSLNTRLTLADWDIRIAVLFLIELASQNVVEATIQDSATDGQFSGARFVFAVLFV